MNFLEWQALDFKLHLIEICSLWCNGEWANIGSDSGVDQKKQQAIIWTNEGLTT